MEFSEKIEPVKQLIKSKNFTKYIKKFSDVHISNKLIYLECKLHNNHTINFITPLNSQDIYINMYGTSKLPLLYDGKIRHKFIKIVQGCLQVIHNADKGDLHLFLFKFYIEAVKYLSNKFNGYDIPYMDELSIKTDIHGLISKLYGYGKKTSYEKLMREYYEVIM